MRAAVVHRDGEVDDIGVGQFPTAGVVCYVHRVHCHGCWCPAWFTVVVVSSTLVWLELPTCDAQVDATSRAPDASARSPHVPAFTT